MKFSTVFFDIDYCLLDTPTSERRIIRELYARQGQTVGDDVGDEYREINRQLWVYLDRGEITRERLYVMRFQRLFERHPFHRPAEEVAPWFLDQLAHAYDAQPGAAPPAEGCGRPPVYGLQRHRRSDERTCGKCRIVKVPYRPLRR